MKTRKKKSEGSDSKTLSSHSDYLQLYRACISNSFSLIEEARLLYKHKYYARAFFLALTADEELGKSQLIADFINDCFSQEEFEKAFRDHDLKIAYNRRYLTLSEGTKGDATIEYDLKDVKSYIKARMNSLYVNRTGTSPLLPSEVINKDMAKRMIESVIEDLGNIEYSEWLNQRIGTKGLAK